MLDLVQIGSELATRRRTRRLSQTQLARLAGVSRASVEALENGRARELGYSKVAKLLHVLGLELRIGEANLRRPTLDELREEVSRDQSLDRRR